MRLVTKTHNSQSITGSSAVLARQPMNIYDFDRYSNLKTLFKSIIKERCARAETHVTSSKANKQSFMLRFPSIKINQLFNWCFMDSFESSNKQFSASAEKNRREASGNLFRKLPAAEFFAQHYSLQIAENTIQLGFDSENIENDSWQYDEDHHHHHPNGFDWGIRIVAPSIDDVRAEIHCDWIIKIVVA